MSDHPDLPHVLRTARLGADLAALRAAADPRATGADITAAAVEAAISCLLGNRMIAITDPDTWPAWHAIDPPFDPDLIWSPPS